MKTPPAGRWARLEAPVSQARIRLFCLPYAGGSAAVFRPWLDAFSGDIAVCPIELPGRGTRFSEPLFDRLLPLADRVADEILPHLDKPFALFGFSMGALLAFEISRSLQRRYGLTPVHLFVSGRRAPHIPERNPPAHSLPDAELIARLRRLNGTPPRVLEDEELMSLMLPVLRADFALPETYTFIDSEPLSCGLSAYGGLDDPDVARADLEAWSRYTSGRFNVQMFEGDHFFLHTAQAALLGTVAEELDRTAGWKQ